jgi:hypothetical protein
MGVSKPGAASAARTTRKKNAAKRPAKTRAKPALKDPAGGLSPAGRAQYRKTEGARLRPGVKKAASDMTPEDMRRKGSFLRRHFATLRGPLVDKKGNPTRLALSASAWGEAIPKTLAAARKLAQKGLTLLTRYKRTTTATKSGS